MQSQIDAQKIQLEAQAELQIAQAKHEMEKEMATIKAQLAVVTKNNDNQVRRDLEEFKEDRKDERVKKQAVEQSKLISQRKGDRNELTEEQETKSRLDEIRKLMGQ